MLVEIPRDIAKEEWHRETNGHTLQTLRSAGAPAERTKAVEAQRWVHVFSEVDALRGLKDDWDGQGALAPDEEVVASALGLACLLEERQLPPPVRVVPGPNATVILEWQWSDGTYAEIEIVRPFYGEVMLVRPGKPAEHWTIPNEDV